MGLFCLEVECTGQLGVSLGAAVHVGTQSTPAAVLRLHAQALQLGHGGGLFGELAEDFFQRLQQAISGICRCHAQQRSDGQAVENSQCGHARAAFTLF